VSAAIKAGLRGILVRAGKYKPSAEDGVDPKPDVVAPKPPGSHRPYYKGKLIANAAPTAIDPGAPRPCAIGVVYVRERSPPGNSNDQGISGGISKILCNRHRLLSFSESLCAQLD
jgi:hypothetical protein